MRHRYTRRSQSDALAEARMQRAAEAGIPVRTDPPLPAPITLDLSDAGGKRLTLHKCRRGRAWRAVDEATGKAVARAALKELLHKLADALPRTLGARNLN